MRKKLKKLFSSLGPGLITGASDDDPSGIATYAQTGAMFGYGQLWTALFSYPFTVALQEMCGRIGLVSGKGLSGVMKKHYSKTILYLAVALLTIANVINIGADLGAMASSVQLLIPIPFSLLLLSITLITLILEIFVSYKVYSRYLKYLTLSLITYFIAAFIIQHDWIKVITSTLIPHILFSREYIINVVAILGTTISPYLFFWQSDEEVEEEIAKKKLRIMGIGIPSISQKDIRIMRIDTIIGMFYSNFMMLCIMLTTAGTLFVNGITKIETANQAAEALRPIAGDLTFFLFTLGILGTGLLAVPILAGSASYAISEAFGWKEGLYRKITQAHGFYGVITLATLVGLMVNFTSIKPFTMLYIAAVINGMTSPFLIFIIIAIANNKKIMGNHTNSPWQNILGISIGSIILFCSLILFVSFL